MFFIILAALSIPFIMVDKTNQNRVNISWSYENSTIINKGCYYYLEYKKGMVISKFLNKICNHFFSFVIIIN